MNIAKVYLKEGGPVRINGAASVASGEGDMIVIHSHDSGGNCRDTLIPRESIVTISVVYHD